ncbi:hypothetical protein ACFRGK_21120, partial [Bacillus subtilis]
MDTNYKKVIRFSIREEEFKVLEEKNTKGVKTLGIFDAALPDVDVKSKFTFFAYLLFTLLLKIHFFDVSFDSYLHP